MSHAPFRALAAALLALGLATSPGCGSDPVPEPGPDASGTGKADACVACGTACCKADETCNAATNTCEAACVPQCDGRQCGDDGCGKTCGTCTDPPLCSPQGQCVSCLPACEGKECGDDGCGGECGTCTSPKTCNASFLCTCTRKCSGKECGSDGCGGKCGTCDPGETCTSGKCVACTPNCTGKTCGDDGCGGTCAPGCQAPQTCNTSGQCVACTPNCAGKTCGNDGCGGTCAPGCKTGETCTTSGQCLGCTPSCTGKSCGPDGCGGTCAPGCQAPQTCSATGQCVCTPNCTGKTCGPDGCGGTCAPGCQAGQTCSASGQCVCVPSCAGRTCGPDGCGGTCAPGCTAPATCSAAGTCVVALPSAPTNLNAAAQSASVIVLGWTDTSTTESGFKVERATAASGPFAQVGTTGANVATYSATGLAASTTYYFRVRATNSGGDSAYSNSASAKTLGTVPAAPTNLAATSGGVSSISLTWSDVSTNETSFRIERAAASTGPFAQVAVTGANVTSYTNTGLAASTTYYYRVIAANALGDSPASNVASARTQTPTCTATLTAPATNTTGSYAVSWTVNGSLCSTNRRLQEDTTPAFANPTTVVPTGTSRIYTGKPTGTYCYRVDPGGGVWSNTACVNVDRSVSVGTLRIVNSTHYWMIRARVNGVERLSYPYVLDVGRSQDYLFPPGSVPYVLEVGTYDSSNRPQPWFNLQGTASVIAGQTTTVTFANPTIGDLLSNFSNYRDWSGYYFDAANNYRTARYRFFRNGTFAFFDNGVQTNSGTVTLTSWPDYATIVGFKECSTCATINLGYPFGSFQYRNGPASWPIIEYTAQ